MKSKALVQSLPIVLQAHLRPKYFHLNKQLYSLKIKCQVVLVVGILRLVSWMESCEHAQPAENSLKFNPGFGPEIPLSIPAASVTELLPREQFYPNRHVSHCRYLNFRGGSNFESSSQFQAFYQTAFQCSISG